MSGHGAEMEVKSVVFGLIVSSDSILRGIKKDEITPMVKELIESNGHELRCHEIVGNDENSILKSILKCIESGSEIIILTGGTGVSSKDLVIDILKKISDYELPGFGELFRFLSFKDIGSRAWLSRAGAFIYKRSKVLIGLPGSPSAVKLALNRLILPTVKHLMYELRR